LFLHVISTAVDSNSGLRISTNVNVNRPGGFYHKCSGVYHIAPDIVPEFIITHHAGIYGTCVQTDSDFQKMDDLHLCEFA
jgi:hypothetical protein